MPKIKKTKRISKLSSKSTICNEIPSADPSVLFEEEVLTVAGKIRYPAAGKWVTTGGKNMNMKDMDDNHVINSIRILERTAITRVMETFCRTTISRSKKNNYSIYIKSLSEHYAHILGEARRRGLVTTLKTAHIQRILHTVYIKALLLLDRDYRTPVKSADPAYLTPRSPDEIDPLVPQIVLDILATAHHHGIISAKEIINAGILTKETVTAVQSGINKPSAAESYIKSCDAPIVQIHPKIPSRDTQTLDK